MKSITLCGINARFSHSCLALLCLKYSADEQADIRINEYTINDRISDIVDGLVCGRPDAVGFSCYIWNIEHVLKVASTVKKILPNCFILLGGPEASPDAGELMARYDFIDMIISGPGEIPFSHFTEHFQSGQSVEDTPSACVRTGNTLRRNAPAPSFDMNRLRFIYGDLAPFENRIIYYESSRGCPFRCAYCVSAQEPVSLLPLERVKAELEYFMRAGVKQVKLVDRTFNYPPGRAREILQTLIALKKEYPQSPARFHLELSACLLDEEMISLLTSAPEGLLHLEIGIQSTHPETLREVYRSHDTDTLLRNTAALCASGNLSVHVDLIAGLPYEGYTTFGASFDAAYRLCPNELQLGFLKLLRGTSLRARAQELGIIYTSYAPYEVLSTPDISYEELSELHRIADLVDTLHNSGHFKTVLSRLVPAFELPFALFERLAACFYDHGYFDRPQPPQRAFELLAEFAVQTDCEAMIREALAYDWCLLGNSINWPQGIEPAIAPEEQQRVRDFFRNPAQVEKYLPAYKNLPLRQVQKHCRICVFRCLFGTPAWVLFDYGIGSGAKTSAQPIILP